MLNQTVMVGRLVKDPIMEVNDNGNKICRIILAIPRAYKNMNGEYDTDYFPAVLRRGVAENTYKYIKKGDIVGLKGSLENINKNELNVTIVADKVTFLSSSKKQSDDIEFENEKNKNYSNSENDMEI